MVDATQRTPRPRVALNLAARCSILRPDGSARRCALASGRRVHLWCGIGMNEEEAALEVDIQAEAWMSANPASSQPSIFVT